MTSENAPDGEPQALAGAVFGDGLIGVRGTGGVEAAGCGKQRGYGYPVDLYKEEKRKG
jgi:hypothetical protein